jgi:flagellar biogenesis protein FliO
METEAASDVHTLPERAGATTVTKIWEWVQRVAKSRRSRRLRVCETLSLGERRFLAIVEFDQEEFLVGGGGNSLELLARLHEGRVITEPRRRGNYESRPAENSRHPLDAS